MRALAVALWFLLPQAALAAPVAVSSGEHPGFTRLVFDYGAAIDWRFGRSADGYEITVNGAQPAYDLRGVFHPIGTTRLAAIWPDPGTGSLHIGIACACHAMPFEFRPGVIVVDLRDGPPPVGSSFEAMLDGSAAGALSHRPPPRPKARPPQLTTRYDWLSRTINQLPAPHSASPALTPETGAYGIALATRLEPLRQQLLEQISLGAAQGIVEMSHPGQAPAAGLPSEFASAQIVIGGNRGSLTEADRPTNSDLGAAGTPCIAAERLDVAAWGSEGAVAEQWSAAMSGLVGEFDRPDPEALARAVRFDLYLGFGAEARQMMQSFGTDLGEAPLWRAMSYILDGEPGDLSTLRDQTACDGPAALWSALSEEGPLPKTANAAAIRLALSDLPVHLRSLLAPRLAQRFLASGDTEGARAIRDATQRANPGDPAPPIALLGAEIDDKTGDPQAAESRLRRVVDAGGSGAIEALAGLVELRARRGLAARPEDVAALEASYDEQGGDRSNLSAAIILGKAAAGDPAGALALLPGHEVLEPELWNLIASLGTDRQVLELAVLSPDARPSARPETATKLAQRLSTLGLAGPAALWLAARGEGDPVVHARVELARANPDKALVLLAGQTTEEANALRLAALNQLGDNKAAAKALAAMGDTAAAQSALGRAGAWPDLAAGEASPLQELAATVTAPPTAPVPADAGGTEAGQLAHSHQLLEASAATRSLIDSVLAAAPAPGT